MCAALLISLFVCARMFYVGFFFGCCFFWGGGLFSFCFRCFQLNAKRNDKCSRADCLKLVQPPLHHYSIATGAKHSYPHTERYVTL